MRRKVATINSILIKFHSSLYEAYMKKITLSIIFTAFLATSSWALFDGCLEKRLPRELEFKLMYDCVTNNCTNTYGTINEKIAACSCLIGSMLCEQSEKELQTVSQQTNTCSIAHNKKKLTKCLDKKIGK
jgi:hypothetical protein